MLILGLDAGVNGALAFLQTYDWTLEILDVPKVKKTISGKVRHHVDHEEMARIIKLRCPDLIVTEHLWSRPGQDAKSVFSLGRYAGQVEMAASMIGAKLTQPTPQEWKGDLSVSADKKLSSKRAIQLIPALSSIMLRDMDHDRGEAALLAFWGALQSAQVPRKIKLINPPSSGRKKAA